MTKRVEPLHGRTAEVNQYVTSDLSVEEQLAGGASVDDLIEAGVLYDDPDEGCFFTPEPTEEEMAAKRERAARNCTLTKEEQLAKVRAYIAELGFTPDDIRRMSAQRRKT